MHVGAPGLRVSITLALLEPLDPACIDATMIPKDVRRFVLTRIPSIPHLEAALALRRDRTTQWDAVGMARAIYVTPQRAAEVLRDLTAAGVAEFDPPRQTFRYSPCDDQLSSLMDQLAEMYRVDTVGITRLVHDMG
jgi:hypothetical protein